MIRHEYVQLHFKTPASRSPYVSLRSNQHLRPYFERASDNKHNLNRLDLVFVLQRLSAYRWLSVTTIPLKNKSMMILHRNISKIARVDYVSDSSYIKALEKIVSNEYEAGIRANYDSNAKNIS